MGGTYLDRLYVDEELLECGVCEVWCVGDIAQEAEQVLRGVSCASRGGTCLHGGGGGWAVDAGRGEEQRNRPFLIRVLHRLFLLIPLHPPRCPPPPPSRSSHTPPSSTRAPCRSPPPSSPTPPRTTSTHASTPRPHILQASSSASVAMLRDRPSGATACPARSSS